MRGATANGCWLSSCASGAADLVMSFPILVLAERSAVAGDVTPTTSLGRLTTTVPARLRPTTSEIVFISFDLKLAESQFSHTHA